MSDAAFDRNAGEGQERQRLTALANQPTSKKSEANAENARQRAASRAASGRSR